MRECLLASHNSHDRADGGPFRFGCDKSDTHVLSALLGFVSNQGERRIEVRHAVVVQAVSVEVDPREATAEMFGTEVRADLLRDLIRKANRRCPAVTQELRTHLIRRVLMREIIDMSVRYNKILPAIRIDIKELRAESEHRLTDVANARRTALVAEEVLVLLEV